MSSFCASHFTVWTIAFATPVYLKNRAIPGLFFFILVYSIQLVEYINLPVTGFEQRTSSVGSDRSTNSVTTIATAAIHFISVVIIIIGSFRLYFKIRG